jgi:choline dehydrogenase-like flavoprotein
VRLSRQLDPLGVPRVEVDWRVTDEDLGSIHRAQEALRDALDRSHVGHLERLLGDEKPPPLMVGNAHHMGTTRMHQDETLGVVDANCRVHGVANLFIAGSSVFPTCGYANPTLTIVALALRLSDHLGRGAGL